MTTNTAHQKYRPYFSASELQEIIRCVKASSTNQSLLGYLEAFAMKIDRGILSPQLEVRPSIEEKLGLMQALPGPVPPTPTELYQIWTKNPEYLSASQLAIVHQYRWENGFMSSKEEVDYEQSIGI